MDILQTKLNSWEINPKKLHESLRLTITYKIPLSNIFYALPHIWPRKFV